jgi:catalase
LEAASVRSLTAKLTTAGAVVHLVANNLAPVVADDKTIFTPHHSLLSTASVCFDAVYVASGKKSIDILKAEPAAILFVNEAYKHCKAIGFGKQAEAFIELTNVQNTMGTDPAVFQESGNGFAKDFISAIANHRVWDLEEARNNPA